MQKSLNDQIAKLLVVFRNNGIKISSPNEILFSKENTVPLLVLPSTILPTKDLFDQIDLGNKKDNTWFLDLKYMYDLVKTPEEPYILQNVNIATHTFPKEMLQHQGVMTWERQVIGLYQHNETRPLTFHEVVTLAFHYPELFNEKISGMQAYGSRFTKDTDLQRPFTDDTLEIYRKGDLGNGFLKLARELHRYHEQSKIIPFVEV